MSTTSLSKVRKESFLSIIVLEAIDVASCMAATGD
jgi:hypothetical protein